MPSYLITGAGRGLGYAWLKCLSSSQTNTIIGLVRNKAATEKRLAADKVTNVQLVLADSGDLDVLINNAGILPERSVFKTVIDSSQEVLEEDLIDSFKVNVVGVANTVKAFMPLIRKGEAKKVIYISSIMADMGLVNGFSIDNAGPYAVSKAAGNMLIAKYHAAAGAAWGILFMSTAPGIVMTRETPLQLSEEENEGRKAMDAKFKEHTPHFTGPTTSEESVRMPLPL